MTISRMTYIFNLSQQTLIEFYITIDISFLVGPSAVRIKYDQLPLSVGKSYKIQCEAIGSKPMASISWWIDEKQVKSLNVGLNRHISH